MRNVRGEFVNVGRFLTQELLPTIRDIALEPIKFSLALKERLTGTSLIPNYKDLGRATRAMVQITGYMWGSFPILMPVATASGLIMQGNVVDGLLVGGGTWMAEGALLKVTRTRDQYKEFHSLE